MAIHPLDTGNGLFNLHSAPRRPAAPTFVFVNALTGSTDHWEKSIAPALRAQGFGTLSYNFRGQTDSPFAPGTALTPALIVADLGRLLADLSPRRPVLVGLSIGVCGHASPEFFLRPSAPQRCPPMRCWSGPSSFGMARSALLRSQ